MCLFVENLIAVLVGQGLRRIPIVASIIGKLDMRNDVLQPIYNKILTGILLKCLFGIVNY